MAVNHSSKPVFSLVFMIFSYAASGLGGVEMALTRGFRPRGLVGSALGLSRCLVFVVGVVFGLRVVALVAKRPLNEFKF